MTTGNADLGPAVERIVSVLAYALLFAIGGLIVIGILGGDPGVRMTLTHIVETLVGVFIGIAVARLAPR
jgi:hypothetical protein